VFDCCVVLILYLWGRRSSAGSFVRKLLLVDCIGFFLFELGDGVYFQVEGFVCFLL
jgi:hypothetical protein